MTSIPAGPIPLTSEAGAQYLHHFRIDRTLASGGMGSVYVGYDTSLNRPVAIKVIRPELARMEGFSQRFVREAQAQAQIAHSNVVQVYFIGEQAGTFYIVMELVDGGSLDAVRGMDWKDAVRHMTGLAEGLREASRLGIVHRDIKPANVLLDRFGLAHLADFGLAAAAEIPEPVTGSSDTLAPGQSPTLTGQKISSSLPKLTQVGAIMGSPGYMSPEQAHGKPLDARADIFSLGATFYELLTGDPPVRAETIPGAQEFYAKTAAIPPIRTKARRVPKKLAAVIDRCLRFDAAARYPDYDALLKDLAAAAPEPMVPATFIQRLAAYALDVAVFGAVTGPTFLRWPPLGFAAMAVWVIGGAALLEATPGQWLMRLHLRTTRDTEPSPLRSAVRFTLQHGWLFFAALTLHAIYASAGEARTLASFALAVLLGAPSLLGSLAAPFTSKKQALHDLLSGTMVLVNTR
ncbi:MAG TPA: protein kinase [Myxococcaceae bacterium]|nr:protein kinase [Myxococcaceae bacterium]